MDATAHIRIDLDARRLRSLHREARALGVTPHRLAVVALTIYVEESRRARLVAARARRAAEVEGAAVAGGEVRPP